MMRCLGSLLGCLVFAGGVAPLAWADPFTPGNLAVYRVGDGAGILNGSAAAVFVDEYTTGGVLVQSVALPTADAGNNQMLTAVGSASTEGFLTRSVDGRYLVLTGYDAAPGTLDLATTSSANVNRVVGLISHTGAVDTSTVFDTAYDQSNIRSAATLDGSDVWTSGAGEGGSGGVWHTTIGGTTDTQVSTTITNTRNLLIAGNQLFVSADTGGIKLATVGSGTPSNEGNSIDNLPGTAILALNSPNAYFFADLSGAVGFAATGLDTLYVADDAAGEVKKFTYDGADWVADGSQALGSVRGLTGVVNGSNVTLFATNEATLQSITDTSGYGGIMNGAFTNLATAGSNTAFRGVALAPIPEPGTLTLSGLGLLLAAGACVNRRSTRPAQRSPSPSRAEVCASPTPPVPSPARTAPCPSAP